MVWLRVIWFGAVWFSVSYTNLRQPPNVRNNPHLALKYTWYRLTWVQVHILLMLSVNDIESFILDIYFSLLHCTYGMNTHMDNQRSLAIPYQVLAFTSHYISILRSILFLLCYCISLHTVMVVLDGTLG
jgi:hypothetical protein